MKNSLFHTNHGLKAKKICLKITEESKDNDPTIPNLPLPSKWSIPKKVKKSIIPGGSYKGPKISNNAVRIEELKKVKAAKAENASETEEKPKKQDRPCKKKRDAKEKAGKFEDIRC